MDPLTAFCGWRLEVQVHLQLTFKRQREVVQRKEQETNGQEFHYKGHAEKHHVKSGSCEKKQKEEGLTSENGPLKCMWNSRRIPKTTILFD